MMELTKSLYNIKQEHFALVDELIENGGEITSELETALKINKEEVQEVALSYAGIIRTSEARINEIDDLLKLLQEKKKSINKLVDRLTTEIETAMVEFNVKEIKGTFFDLKLRKSESIEILNPFEAARTQYEGINDKYLKVKATKDFSSVSFAKMAVDNGEVHHLSVELSKTAVKDAIKSKELTTGDEIVVKGAIQQKLIDSKGLELTNIVNSINQNLQIK